MIMEITLINDSNYSAFWNMFFDGTDLTRKDILRIGAVEQGIAVGALSAGFTSGTCNIRSLYTVSDKRRRGAAHGMLHKLKSILAKSSYDVIKSDFASDTDGVAEFFESEGFILHEGEGFYQTCLQDFLESNIVKKFSLINTEGFEYFHLEDLSNSDKNAVVGLLEERGFDKSYTDLKSLDQHLSSVVYDYGHKPQQCLLASSNEECIFVKLIVSLQKSADAGSISVWIDRLTEDSNEKTHYKDQDQFAVFADVEVEMGQEEGFGHLHPDLVGARVRGPVARFLVHLELVALIIHLGAEFHPHIGEAAEHRVIADQ